MSNLLQIRCNFAFNYLQSHPYSEILVDGQRFFRCSLPLCEKTFRFKSEMNRHLASHSNLRPFPCLYPNCGKTFKRQDALNNHIKYHLEGLAYPCLEQDCTYQFESKAALNYHMLRHSGAKVFRCDQPGCNKVFPTLGQLKQHMRASNYHNRLKAINWSGEGNSLPYYNPIAGPFQRNIDGINLPAIHCSNIENLDQVQKKIKDDKEDFYMEPSRLSIKESDNFTYLKNRYGKMFNEDPKTNINEDFLNHILQFSIKENQLKTESEIKFYNTLKNFIENDNTGPQELLFQNQLISPQISISTINSGDNSLIGQDTIESLEVQKEKSFDFELFLKDEGLDNLST